MKKPVLFFGTAAAVGICTGVAIMLKYCSNCQFKREHNKKDGSCNGNCKGGCKGDCDCHDHDSATYKEFVEKRNNLYDKYNVLSKDKSMNEETDDLITAINKANGLETAIEETGFMFDETNDESNEVAEFDTEKIKLVEEQVAAETEGTEEQPVEETDETATEEVAEESVEETEGLTEEQSDKKTGSSGCCFMCG